MAKIISSILEANDLLPDPLVADRYKVTSRTLHRWDRQKGLGFPPPVTINRRKYRRINQLQDWERRHVALKVG
jgi:DNA-binding transcriptional MerR regulator